MKEYKYKINGNTYKVGVGDIEGNVAQVEVNGVPYKVELAQDAAKKRKGGIRSQARQPLRVQLPVKR